MLRKNSCLEIHFIFFYENVYWKVQKLLGFLKTKIVQFLKIICTSSHPKCDLNSFCLENIDSLKEFLDLRKSSVKVGQVTFFSIFSTLVSSIFRDKCWTAYCICQPYILRRNIHKNKKRKSLGRHLTVVKKLQDEWIMGNSPKIHENWTTICSPKCLWNVILQQ